MSGTDLGYGATRGRATAMQSWLGPTKASGTIPAILLGVRYAIFGMDIGSDSTILRTRCAVSGIDLGYTATEVLRKFRRVEPAPPVADRYKLLGDVRYWHSVWY
eukprot:3317278-Rhodomonas_salina.4